MSETQMPEAPAGALSDAAERLLPDLIALRRAIHAEPELGLMTTATSQKARAALAGLPLEYREGKSTTGFIATLKGRAGGRTVLLRGDMDALPMDEDTGLPFASTIAGRMHACGHDAHTAMLVGAARLLAERRDTLPGTVEFMFQPGEEGHHGARFMIDDGLLDPLPEAAFALHVMPQARAGLLTGRAGPLMASADRFFITLTGQGGHASMPHDARDPIPVACELVMAIQTMVTRSVNVHDPAVVTVGTIHAGTTDNVIPESAKLSGTIRTLSPANRAFVQQRLEQLARGIALAHGMACDVEFVAGFPVTICDPCAVALGREAALALGGERGWRDLTAPIMGAEDFSYVLNRVPGAMFFLGAAPTGGGDGEGAACCHGLHSNRMTLDESVMARGSAFLASMAERFLSDGWKT